MVKNIPQTTEILRELDWNFPNEFKWTYPAELWRILGRQLKVELWLDLYFCS